MCTLPKFLKYLAQVAGAGVSKQNVVAFTLAIHKTAHKSEPWLFYASNEDVDIAIKVQAGDLLVAIDGWSSANLPAPKLHGAFDAKADAEAIGSQSKARLQKVLAGSVELTEGAVMACAALKGGRIMKVAQPEGFRQALDGYGFIHAEMLLLQFLTDRHMASLEGGGICLGVSKRLCAYCATAVNIYEQATGTELFVPDAHWLAYFRWRPPAVLVPYLKDITEALNKSSKKGAVFAPGQRGEVRFVENTSKFDGSRCNQNVIVGFSDQHGGSSPYRGSDADEAPPEVVWICSNSGCPINYGKKVVPVESGGMLSRRVCPVCARDAVELNHYG